MINFNYLKLEVRREIWNLIDGRLNTIIDMHILYVGIRASLCNRCRKCCHKIIIYLHFFHKISGLKLCRAISLLGDGIFSNLLNNSEASKHNLIKLDAYNLFTI